MPKTHESEPETGQPAAFPRKLYLGGSERGHNPDPIEQLRDSHGDATVEVYGDATLQALQEWGGVEDIGELLGDVRALATVDLSEFGPIAAEKTADLSIGERLASSASSVSGEQTFEARYLYEAFEENDAVLSHEIDNE